MVFSIYYKFTYSSSLYTKSSIRTVKKFPLKKKFLKNNLICRVSKYDNINSHILSIDVKSIKLALVPFCVNDDDDI